MGGKGTIVHKTEEKNIIMDLLIISATFRNVEILL